MDSGGSIVRGPDGALWILSGTGFERIDAESSLTQVSTSPVSQLSYGGEITNGPDAALWFADILPASIGRLTTCGQLTEYPIPSREYAESIVAGPDGALWFTEPMGNKIGRITTSGSFTEFPLPTSHGLDSGYHEYPKSIVSGPDGALWFAEAARPPAGGRIGRMTTDGHLTEFQLPTALAAPWKLISGLHGDLWFTESGANQIGRITTAGVVTEFIVSTYPHTRPDPLVQEPDGTIWFGESRDVAGPTQGSNELGRLTPDGKVVLYPIPTTVDGLPIFMVIATDGSIWMTHSSGSLVQAAVKS